MASDSNTIALGFVLTTIVGGGWAAILQSASWRKQHQRQQRDETLRRSADVCSQISGLLDKRWYRMYRLYFAIRRAYEDEENQRARDNFENSLAEYNEILREWNDHLNANLALVYTYFGHKARKDLATIYEEFSAIGGELDRAGRAVLQHQKPTETFSNLEREFGGSQEPATGHSGELSDRVYQFVKNVMIQLREGQVGESAPHEATDA
jgi:hypothetical protein